jgi:hypothetical protein
VTSPEEMLAMEKALEAAKDYADKILSSPLEEIGGILSDTVGYWRLKNRVRLLLKAKKYLEENEIDPAKILPDVFVPLLEDGSNVENETLSNMFASLLASHLDSNKQENIHPSYTKVLSQLSPLDAVMMIEFRSHASDAMYRDIGPKGHVLSVIDIAKHTNTLKKITYLSCLNLERLGILEHVGYRAPEGHPIPDMFEDSIDHQLYRISEYGVRFCDACHNFDEDLMPYFADNNASQ